MQFLVSLFSSPCWFLVICVIYAPVWGSILACALDRSIHKESHFTRSHCRNCGRVLSALEMIPIISYLYLRGRCLGCCKKIDPTSLYLEVISALLFPVLGLKFGPSEVFLGSAIMLSVLIWISTRDVAMYSLSLGELGVLLCAAVLCLYMMNFDFVSQVYQAMFTALIFFAMSWIYQVVRGRIGFGIADIVGIFCLAMHITSGFWGILRFLFIALFSAFAAICIIYKKEIFQKKIPFIPFLTVGWLVAILMDGSWWFTEVKNWSAVLIF